MIDDVLQGRETEIADELVHKVKGEFVRIKNDILALCTRSEKYTSLASAVKVAAPEVLKMTPFVGLEIGYDILNLQRKYL
jgi:hypothetical protein